MIALPLRRRDRQRVAAKLRRSAHRSVTELEADIRQWMNAWNANPRPFV